MRTLLTTNLRLINLAAFAYGAIALTVAAGGALSLQAALTSTMIVALAAGYGQYAYRRL